MYQDSDYKGRDKEFLGCHNTWNAQEIAKNESKVVCAMGFYSFTALIDMKPKPAQDIFIRQASHTIKNKKSHRRGLMHGWIILECINFNAIVQDAEERTSCKS